MSSSTDILTEAGIDLDAVADEERAILAALSPEEAAVLASVKGKLDGVEPDVEGHVGVVAGGVFF